MTRTIILSLLLLVVWGALSAQFDERSILTQQAQQLMARRQYSEAEQLFQEVLRKFPGDSNSLNQLLQLYYLTSQIDKAENLLESSKRNMPQTQYTEQRILLYVMQGKVQAAWELAQGYLNQFNHDQGRYRIMASYFERRGFYDQVLELYRSARKHHKNDNLFMMEYANTALNYRLFEVALREYLRFLNLNPGNVFFVNNQCKTILQEDPSMISVIAEFASGEVNPVILELYATSLVNLKRPLQALEIYKTMSADKLRSFAEEQYAALNDEVAYPAYEHLVETGTDELMKADYRQRMAQIQIRNARYHLAHEILLDIINDQQLLDRRIRNRTGVNLTSRKMMAELILSTTAEVDSALAWYDKAKAFARNSFEVAEIDLEIGRLLIMNEAYNAASDQLARISDKRLDETRDYYLLLKALMQNEIAKADTLMNEYIIRYPGSSYTNDSIYLLMLVYGMDEGDKALFLEAYRKKQLHQKDSIAKILAVFEHNRDEELRLLAVEWSLQLADRLEAMQILDYDWQDPIASEYAALIKLKLIEDSEYEQRFAREFLKQNPNSIWSPNFRQVISRMSQSRPNL